MTIRQRGASWQADLTISGKRLRRDFDTRPEAELWEAQARASMLQGIDPEDAARRPGAVTLGELRQRVCDRIWKGTKGEATAVLNSSLVVRHFGADLPITAITGPKIDAWVSTMETHGNSGGTINRKLAALSKMLRFAQARGWITALPPIERRNEGEGRIRFLQDEEETAILATLHQWSEHDLADLVVFLLDTGCRLGEAVRLAWEDVSEGRRVTFWITKAGEMRTIPLTTRAQEVLARRRHLASPFGDLSMRRVRSVWDRLRGHLKMPDVVLHTLRHTCATRLVRRGVDIRRVQTWMGHKTITVTIGYAKLVPTDLDFLAEVLEGKRQPLLTVAPSGGQS